MPFVNVKVVEGCLHRRPETRHGRGPDRGDSQARGLRGVPRRRLGALEELHPDGWHIGGVPFREPKSLMEPTTVPG